VEVFMTVEAMTPRVREALGVSAQYDAETIPFAIRRTIKRLLRDYHFPKSVADWTWKTTNTDPDPILAVGQTVFPLPAGFKKDIQIIYTQPGVDVYSTYYSDPLKKLEGFRAPHVGCEWNAKYYWLAGGNFIIDKSLVTLPTEPLGLTLTYENWDVKLNENWMCEDFEDVIFLFCVYRTAAEMRKPDVMKAFQPLWQEEQASLAIYTNELEWDNVNVMMREPVWVHSDRYPIHGSHL
jgi:hypothetical protein